MIKKCKFVKNFNMNLEGIINVAGKAGLFKVISRSNNTVIIESLFDKKRTPIYSHNQANLLEEIGIYTYDETTPLSEIFDIIASKENGAKCLTHKSDKNQLNEYFRSIVEDYDEERVYFSDIKKVIQWYNIMHEAGLIEIKKEEKKAVKKTIKKTIKKEQNN